MDYEKIVGISEAMIGGIKESSYIINCLTDIKGTDEYTYTHSANVALYSMLIAKWLDLPKYRIQQVMLVGLLHDIGKVKISDNILFVL